ncbi:hypothetical protein BKA70DRAFT_1256975 [Coprinopsis sp. MPI-PUGE-AT-0042]|nr:hypothetical protein BKA70DRAFT_1256975 [Coprinopsis sp. MPI-PUGE-AT-0042]
MASLNPHDSPLGAQPEVKERNPSINFGTCNDDPDAPGVILPIVHQLAPELLCDIFLHCTPTAEEINDKFHDNRISILHTCQRWRNVALHCPSLWSFIVDIQPSWMAFMIQRSILVPINLHLSRDSFKPLTEEMEGLVCDTLSQTSRLASLTIASTSANMGKRASHLTQYAPNLHTLNLKLRYYGEGLSTLSLPAHLLSGGAPRLRTLVLNRCGLPSNLELFKNLSVFRWEGPFRPLYDSPSEVLSALEQMTNLVELELTVSLARLGQATYSQEIAFPKLQSMKVGDHAFLNDCSGLFQHLAIPKSASLTVRCSGMGSSIVHMPRRLPSAPYQATHPLCEELYTVTVTALGDSHLRLDASYHHADSTNPPQHPPPITEIAPSLSFWVNNFDDDVGAHTALEGLSVHNGRVLNLLLSQHYHSSVNILFNPFPFAEHITVNRFTTAHLVTFLREDPFLAPLDPASSSPSPTRERLPFLKCITFSGGVVDNIGDMAAFVDLLSNRAKLGTCAVPKLVFIHVWGLKKEMVEVLQAADVIYEVEEDEEEEDDDDLDHLWALFD